MRVLLIEDDRMVGAGVTQALRGAAYAVDWVTDGKAAVDGVEAETYDLALLDLSLPLADGLTLLRHFRKSYRDLPVIIVTARDRTSTGLVDPTGHYLVARRPRTTHLRLE